MKRDTCKWLLVIGIILVILGYGIILSEKGDWWVSVIIVGGIILLIVAWRGWNSEKREKERQEVRKAQLKAIEKGKTTVELKGKMRKLK